MKMPEYQPKIRKGQIWRKTHGIHHSKIVITQKCTDSYWQTVNYTNRKKHHHIREKDLYLFYELIGHINRKQI